MAEILIDGLAASGLAAAQLFGWVAMGSLLVGKSGGEQLRLPLALLAGSGVSAFTYGILAAVGRVDIAIAAGVALAVLMSLCRWRWTWYEVRCFAAIYKDFFAGSRWLLSLSLITLALYWTIAITPPRDADVMRYHLAHVRQIDIDGIWEAIPDWHYALPFGWSLNYLPFEHIHIPQVAHLINLVLLVLTVGLVLRLLQSYTSGNLIVLLCGVFVYHPFVVKMATTAHLDIYLIFITAVITFYLTRLPHVGSKEFCLLGFAAWIGMQSRYQAMGIGLSVTVVVALLSWRQVNFGGRFFFYLLGVGGAAVLSSPFYLVNLLAFHNPFWPLMVGTINGLGAYKEQMAYAFNVSTIGSLAVGAVLNGIWGVVKEPWVFPLPILTVGLLAASFSCQNTVPRALSFLIGSFLLLWIIAQPHLYPRHILSLFPAVIVGLAPVLHRGTKSWLGRRVLYAGFVGCILGFLGVVSVYSFDSLQYVATGNLKRFHSFTWFYDVYDWANRSTPVNAKFLVIVDSAQSYYLNRAYRRADPCTSAVVVWPAVKGAKDLDLILDVGDYKYVIYEDRDWSGCVGGERLNHSVQEALDKGLLTRVAIFDLRLSSLRILRRFRPSTVWVLVRGKA